MPWSTFWHSFHVKLALFGFGYTGCSTFNTVFNVNFKDLHDVHTRRTTVLRALPVYLREDTSIIFKTCTVSHLLCIFLGTYFRIFFTLVRYHLVIVSTLFTSRLKIIQKSQMLIHQLHFWQSSENSQTLFFSTIQRRFRSSLRMKLS